STVVTRTFSAKRSLAEIADHGVSYIPGTPEMFRMLLDHENFANTDVHTVQTAHIAGSSLEEDLMRRIVDGLASNALQAYGMSECGGLATVSSVADPMEKRLSTVGRPIGSARIGIMNSETA